MGGSFETGLYPAMFFTFLKTKALLVHQVHRQQHSLKPMEGEGNSLLFLHSAMFLEHLLLVLLLHS